MFERITHVTIGNADYDPIEIEAEVYPLADGDALTSIFVQQAGVGFAGMRNPHKEIISVEEWQLDDLIAKLTATRDRIREIRAAE